jgi:hypothetical protein
MFQMALRRSLALLVIGCAMWSRVSLADEPVEWLVGFDKHWSSAIGQIKPSPEALRTIEAVKGGLFAAPDLADAWQERVLQFLRNGLMTGHNAKVFLAPGIGLPAKQMNEVQFQEVSKILTDLKGLPGEKILAFAADDDDGQWELWTTECIYANGYGGGMARVEKTSYGWTFPDLMFDGEKKHLEVLRFWDLALSNDTMEDVKGPPGTHVIGPFVKLVLERTIEPKATTTIFATRPKRTDQVLLMQNECRRFLSARIVKDLQKGKPMLTNHSGFRMAKWGGNFEETTKLLMPFLLHDAQDTFISSRLTPDLSILYSKHLATTDAVAKTIKSDLWPSLLTLQVQQITNNLAERIGIIIATHSFTGRYDKLDEFIATTGIPVAPNLDYWSYATPAGRYTAWFIDDQFYAMDIEPLDDTVKQADAVMADLTQRYGAFTNKPGKLGKSHFIHEDSDGGTIVMYEPRGNSKELKRIYHYSLKMRPMVSAKLAALKAEADKKASDDKAATAKKASQF